jgi:hypothetical protein
MTIAILCLVVLALSMSVIQLVKSMSHKTRVEEALAGEVMRLKESLAAEQRWGDGLLDRFEKTLSGDR